MALLCSGNPVRIRQYQMPRSDRLFRLLTAMRMLPQPVTAARLADETGDRYHEASVDINAMPARCALIRGEAVFVYTLT